MDDGWPYHTRFLHNKVDQMLVLPLRTGKKGGCQVPAISTFGAIRPLITRPGRDRALHGSHKGMQHGWSRKGNRNMESRRREIKLNDDKTHTHTLEHTHTQWMLMELTTSSVSWPFWMTRLYRSYNALSRHTRCP